MCCPPPLRAVTHIALVRLRSQSKTIPLPFAFQSPSIARFVDATERTSDASDTAEGESKKMERAKMANATKIESVNAKSARAPLKKTGRKPKAEKLVCRYCGSEDLAPSFIKRRDGRCWKCFSKRYGSVATKKAKSKK